MVRPQADIYPSPAGPALKPAGKPAGQRVQALGQKAKPGVVLLVLDGKRQDKVFLPSVVQICRQGDHRLDILMISPPSEPLHRLGRFLQLLERSGIDYRLSIAEGGLADEALRYVQAHRLITMVLLGSDRTYKLDAASLLLREMGYPVGLLTA